MGRPIKCQGWKRGGNWRVNCVTGENRFQPQNIQAKEVFYNKSFENLLGTQIPFIHVYTRIPKSAKNITFKLTIDLTNKHHRQNQYIADDIQIKPIYLSI